MDRLRWTRKPHCTWRDKESWYGVLAEIAWVLTFALLVLLNIRA